MAQAYLTRKLTNVIKVQFILIRSCFSASAAIHIKSHAIYAYISTDGGHIGDI